MQQINNENDRKGFVKTKKVCDSRRWEQKHANVRRIIMNNKKSTVEYHKVML